MSARVDPDAGMNVAPVLLGAATVPEALAPLAIDPDDRYDGPALPSDHPAWMRDALSLSQRARTLIATLRPVVMHVIGVWEHRMRSVVIAGRTVKIDASGSYRME